MIHGSESSDSYPMHLAGQRGVNHERQFRHQRTKLRAPITSRDEDEDSNPGVGNVLLVLEVAVNGHEPFDAFLTHACEERIRQAAAARSPRLRRK